MEMSTFQLFNHTLTSKFYIYLQKNPPKPEKKDKKGEPPPVQPRVEGPPPISINPPSSGLG